MSRPAGPGRGHKKPKKEIGEILLRDLHKAYENAELPTDSGAVKAMRELAHKDLPKFLTIWAKAHGEGDGVRISETEVATVATQTAKEEKVETLIDKLLAEWEVEDAGSYNPAGTVPGGGTGGDEAGGEGNGQPEQTSGVRESGVEVAGAKGGVGGINRALGVRG